MTRFGDQLPHQLDEVVTEERIYGGLLDAEWDPFDYLDLGESELFHFRDEDTLRQGS